MNHSERDELDDMIDGALRGYSCAEPPDGLEERVLRRIGAVAAPPRRLWLRGLAFAVPVAAALVLAAVVFWTGGRRSPGQRPAEKAPVLASAKPVPQPPLRGESRRVARRERRVVTKPPLPKQEVFPVPQPATAEERTLAAWARIAPAAAKQALEDLQSRAAAPVEIQTIEIPPLQVDGAQ